MKKAAAVLFTLTTVTVASHSQVTVPPDASPAPAKELQERLAGKVFAVKPASGPAWRWQFDDSGYFFINAGQFQDSGKWRTEDGQLCTEPRKIKPSCNNVHFAGARVFLKRDSGEIVELLPQ